MTQTPPTLGEYFAHHARSAAELMPVVAAYEIIKGEPVIRSAMKGVVEQAAASQDGFQVIAFEPGAAFYKFMSRARFDAEMTVLEHAELPLPPGSPPAEMEIKPVSKGRNVPVMVGDREKVIRPVPWDGYVVNGRRFRSRFEIDSIFNHDAREKDGGAIVAARNSAQSGRYVILEESTVFKGAAGPFRSAAGSCLVAQHGEILLYGPEEAQTGLRFPDSRWQMGYGG